jgi:hypothetical protein
LSQTRQSNSGGGKGPLYRPPAAPQNSGNRGSHWYPAIDQVKDPATLQNTLRVVLDQFYALQDAHDALQKSHAELQKQVSNSTTTGANGPANTKLLGLNVEPVDVNSLANGAALKYNSKRGTFSFQ